MAIGTDSGIWFFGTQTEVSSSQTTLANNAYVACGSNFTNSDDAPSASAVMKLQFDTTAPTVGNILLFGELQDVQSTNDMDAPSDNYPHVLLGAFPIVWSKAIDTDYYTTIPHFELPVMASSQVIQFWIKNNGTGQTIGTGWQLWITPKTLGPHA